MGDHDAQAELIDAALGLAEVLHRRELRGRGVKLAPEGRSEGPLNEKRLVAAAAEYRRHWELEPNELLEGIARGSWG